MHWSKTTLGNVPEVAASPAHHPMPLALGPQLSVAAQLVSYAAMAGEIEAAGVAELRARQRSAVLENEALIAEKRAQREREKEENRVSSCRATLWPHTGY